MGTYKILYSRSIFGVVHKKGYCLMAEMYEIIEELLRDRGISGVKMSTDLGMSRSFMTELRKGRAKSITTQTAQKIADYFGVTLDYLLTGEQKEKAPAETGERAIDDDDIKAAFFGGVADDLSTEEIDELWEDARRFARYIAEQKKKEK